MELERSCELFTPETPERKHRVGTCFSFYLTQRELEFYCNLRNIITYYIELITHIAIVRKSSTDGPMFLVGHLSTDSNL